MLNLYNAKRDGDSLAMFHIKCDGHVNTLSVIRTMSEKIFWGLTRLAWQNKFKELEDDKAFYRIYYRNINIKTEIFRNSLYCPVFERDKNRFSY